MFNIYVPVTWHIRPGSGRGMGLVGEREGRQRGGKSDAHECVKMFGSLRRKLDCIRRNAGSVRATSALGSTKLWLDSAM